MLPRLVCLPRWCSMRDWFWRLKSFCIFSLPLQCPLWEGIWISGPSHVIFGVPYSPLLFIFHFNACKTGMVLFIEALQLWVKSQHLPAFSVEMLWVVFFPCYLETVVLIEILLEWFSVEKCKKAKTFLLESFPNNAKKKGTWGDIGWGRIRHSYFGFPSSM